MIFKVEMFLMLRSDFYSILNFSYKLASYVSCAWVLRLSGESMFLTLVVHATKRGLKWNINEMNCCLLTVFFFSVGNIHFFVSCLCFFNNIIRTVLITSKTSQKITAFCFTRFNLCIAYRKKNS
jgi:hypothetical protein